MGLLKVISDWVLDLHTRAEAKKLLAREKHIEAEDALRKARNLQDARRSLGRMGVGARIANANQSPSATKRPVTARASRSVMEAPLQQGRSGSKLRFQYADADGVITDRTISKWTEYRDHVVGHCTKRKENRTFRKDRVIMWLDGEDDLISGR